MKCGSGRVIAGGGVDISIEESMFMKNEVPLQAKDRSKISTIEWNEKVDWFRSLHVTIEEIVERDISWKIVVVDNIWRLTCVVVIVVEVLATKGLNDDEACTRLLEFLL